MITLRIGFDPTQFACAHDMSNRLIAVSRDIISPIRLSGVWISLSPRMESTGIEYPP